MAGRIQSHEELDVYKMAFDFILGKLVKMIYAPHAWVLPGGHAAPVADGAHRS
jgi:hypothetical protein